MPSSGGVVRMFDFLQVSRFFSLNDLSTRLHSFLFAFISLALLIFIVEFIAKEVEEEKEEVSLENGDGNVRGGGKKRVGGEGTAKRLPPSVSSPPQTFPSLPQRTRGNKTRSGKGFTSPKPSFLRSPWVLYMIGLWILVTVGYGSGLYQLVEGPSLCAYVQKCTGPVAFVGTFAPVTVAYVVLLAIIAERERGMNGEEGKRRGGGGGGANHGYQSHLHHGDRMINASSFSSPPPRVRSHFSDSNLILALLQGVSATCAMSYIGVIAVPRCFLEAHQFFAVGTMTTAFPTMIMWELRRRSEGRVAIVSFVGFVGAVTILFTQDQCFCILYAYGELFMYASFSYYMGSRLTQDNSLLGYQINNGFSLEDHAFTDGMPLRVYEEEDSTLSLV